MKSYILMTLILFSCAHKAPTKAPSNDAEVKLTEKDIRECKAYENEVLMSARGNEKMVFAEDETSARSFLNRFDVTKGLPTVKAGLVNSILRDCSEERMNNFDVMYKFVNRCTLTFSELEYFQTLAVALKTYRWPIDLKLEGKKVALDYVKFFSEGDFPLVNRLVALSVLDELSVNKIVNEKLHSEIRQHMSDAKTYVESLQLKVENEQALSCRSLSIMKEELEYSSKVSKTIKDLLTRI